MPIYFTIREIFFLVSIVLILIIIFDQRRNPTSTVGWVLVLILLPGIGFFLYLFLGQDWTKRRLFSLKAEDDQRISEEVLSQKKELERIGADKQTNRPLQLRIMRILESYNELTQQRDELLAVLKKYVNEDCPCSMCADGKSTIAKCKEKEK